MKLSLDSNKNVVINFENCAVIITKYAPSVKAIIANFTYLPPREMVMRIRDIFDSSPSILKMLKTAGKNPNFNDGDKLKSIAFFYDGSKHRIDNHFSDNEILKNLLK